QSQRLQTLKQQIESLRQQRAGVGDTLLAERTAWEDQQRRDLKSDKPWQVLSPVKVDATSSRLVIQPGRIVFAETTTQPKDTYTVDYRIDAVTGDHDYEIASIRLEALQHSTFTAGEGLARSDSGNFVLTSLRAALVPQEQTSNGEKKSQFIPVPVTFARATFEQRGFPVENALDGKANTGWAVNKPGGTREPHAAVFQLKESISVPEGYRMQLRMHFESKFAKHIMGRFRVSTSSQSDLAPSVDANPIREILHIAAADRSPEENNLLSDTFLRGRPEVQRLDKRIDQLTKEQKQLQNSIAKVMVMGTRDTPRDTFILTRGLYNKPTQRVTAATPRFLDFATSQRGTDAASMSNIRKDDSHDTLPAKDRRDLARWITDRNNPLTARVLVNRLWQQFFGIGLVKTPEDFGVQGEIPLHMNLLNWLAAELHESGWDQKHLIRLMLNSHTYRQRSDGVDPNAYKVDPANRLMARGARYRMPSWMIRDAALAAAGLLSDHSTGPSVNTYQPDGVWEEASFGKKTYRRDSGDKLYRRSLYIFWRRIAAPTMLFDASGRQTCSVKVNRTNTPLHALQVLNDKIYVEAARVLAQRCLAADETGQSVAPDDQQILNRVFQRVLARDATEPESRVLLAGLQRARTQFQADPDQAKKLIAIGESQIDTSLDPTLHAAWTTLCLTVLNLDETLNRE
ncbi:MAG: DUF1553 domain-containing protein, partial [Planctomycetota bacterium]